MCVRSITKTIKTNRCLESHLLGKKTEPAVGAGWLWNDGWAPEEWETYGENKKSRRTTRRWVGWVWNLHLSSRPPFVHVADWSTHPQHLVTEPSLCLPESFAIFLHIFPSLVYIEQWKGSALEIQVYSQLKVELFMYGGMCICLCMHIAHIWRLEVHVKCPYFFPP